MSPRHTRRNSSIVKRYLDLIFESRSTWQLVLVDGMHYPQWPRAMPGLPGPGRRGLFLLFDAELPAMMPIVNPVRTAHRYNQRAARGGCCLWPR